VKAIDLVLRGDHIALDALLKSTGLAPSGGAAKALIGEGKVQVDGRDELRKTCKIRAGQVVRIGDSRVRVLDAAAADAAAAPAADPADAGA
jgi:ribosome-associated protein